MTGPAIVTLVVLAVAMALFASDRMRLDLVALLALLALVLGGILPADEALAGFAHPLVPMIAGLFVVGAALTDTGVADQVGTRLGVLAGAGEVRVLVVVMLATAALSAFMSSTGTVAILLPVVGTIAQARGIPPGRVFLPLAFGAHLGSLLTLIATPPNLVVAALLQQAGHAPFRFFSFFPAGAILLVLGVAFVALVGRRLLPGGAAAPPPGRAWTMEDFAREYGVAADLHTLRVPASSPLVGRTLAQANLRADHRVNVIGIASQGRDGPAARPVLPTATFAAGDVLRVQGREEDVARVAAAFGLERLADRGALALPPDETLIEVVLPRCSRLVGRTLREVRFRDRYRATALAVRRGAGAERPVPATPALRDVPLRAGDMLLLKGRTRNLRNLRDERRDFVLVAEPDPRAGAFLDRPRARAAIAITGALLAVMAFGWLDNAIAVLAAAMALVLSGCVRPADAYRSIHWEIVVLVGAMLPVAAALERTGVTATAVGALEPHLAGLPPRLVLAALAAATSALGLVISNTATALLVAPVALRVAEQLQIAPAPLLMGVAFAASTAFSTPVASPVNALVVGPGGYRFADFVKVGLPLQLLLLAGTVLLVPIFFPF